MDENQVSDTQNEENLYKKVLEVLEESQTRVEEIQAKAELILLQDCRHFHYELQEYYKKRNEMIETVPFFWWYAISNHPLLYPLFKGGVIEDSLLYLTNIKVFEITATIRQFNFYFRENPYFTNRLLIKEVNLTKGGFTTDRSFIHWQNQVIPDLVGQNLDERLAKNFYEWYLGNRPVNLLVVAFKLTELWEGPLKWIMHKPKAAPRPRKLRNGSEGQTPKRQVPIENQSSTRSTTKSPYRLRKRSQDEVSPKNRSSNSTDGV